MDAVAWLGIAFCATQSALFSGLNIATFGVSRLRLETEAATGSSDAIKLLALRTDANFLLATILWGNVGINVLLTLLSNSVMAGMLAFLFSTIVITFLGEILPQAYFVRNAMRMAARLAPLLRFYQVLLYPVAKPCALLLDWVLGGETVEYFRERDLQQLITRHAHAPGAVDVSRIEGVGAANFLTLDDVAVGEEGEAILPLSVVAVAFNNAQPVFPEFRVEPTDPFLRQLAAAGRKWVVLTDLQGEPQLVMDADGFLRDVLFGDGPPRPLTYCHRPIISRDPGETLGRLLPQLRVDPEHAEDDVIDQDVILLWGQEKRVTTGADVLGRLLRGIVRRENHGGVPDVGHPGSHQPS